MSRFLYAAIAALTALYMCGCTTYRPESGNPERTGTVEASDFEDLNSTVTNLDKRLGTVETRITDVNSSLGLLVTTTKTTTERISALTSSVNAGMFAGSGIYAFAALVAVLVAQLGGLVLWWKLRREVKQNNGLKSASPGVSASTEPVQDQSPPPVEPRSGDNSKS